MSEEGLERDPSNPDEEDGSEGPELTVNPIRALTEGGVRYGAKESDRLQTLGYAVLATVMAPLIPLSYFVLPLVEGTPFIPLLAAGGVMGVLAAVLWGVYLSY